MSIKSFINVATLASFGSWIASVMPRFLIACMVMTCGLFPTQTAMAQSTHFTYQGKLTDGGVPVNGSYDVFFTPYAALTGSQTLGPELCADNVPVVDGLFTVQIPFQLPSSGPLFLGLKVRQDQGADCSNTAGLVELSPRQEVTPAPHALYAVAIREDPARVRGALRLTALGALDIFDGSRWRRIEAVISNLPAVVSGSEFFETSGFFTFVVPQGVTEIYVAAWGGSGGGGALGPGSINIGADCAPGNIFACAGGGGARGASIGARITVTPGETLNIVVGGGGATRTNQTGGNGGTSAVRRGAVDVIVAPGGGGGGRASAAVSMPSASQTTFCSSIAGILAAPAGAAPAAAQLLGAGTIISTSNTSDATGGRGPSCWTNTVSNFPNPPVTTEGTCPALPGEGGDTANIFLDTAIPNATAPANGGNGAGPSTPATPGGPGRVRIYWF